MARVSQTEEYQPFRLTRIRPVHCRPRCGCQSSLRDRYTRVLCRIRLDDLRVDCRKLVYPLQVPTVRVAILRGLQMVGLQHDGAAMPPLQTSSECTSRAFGWIDTAS